MSHCKIIGYAFSLFPVKKWQDLLIRFHMEGCSDCQKTLISRETVQGMTIQESQCAATESMWDGFDEKVKGTRNDKQQVFRPHWSWAYGLVIALVSVSVVAWFILSPLFRTARVEEGLNGHFRINYIQVENKPAQAYIYQPQDSHMILVWAQKNTSGE